MKKFTRQTIFFLLPIFIFGWATESLLKHIPNDYAYKKAYLDDNARSLDILFLGNSHVFYGINPEFLTLNSFNASHPSQTLKYDFEILDKYKNDFQKLKYIVVSLDYFTLFTTLESGLEPWRVKNYTIYYGLNSTNKISDFFEIFSNKMSLNLGRILDYYFQKKSTISCSKTGWGFAYNSSKNQDLVSTGKSAALRHTVGNDMYFNENIKTLKSIIELAQKKGVKVIILTSPAYFTYTENLDKNQMEKTVKVATEMTHNYGNCQYLNLLSDSSFIKSDFFDADHLNESGAERLTRKLGAVCVF